MYKIYYLYDVKGCNILWLKGRDMICVQRELIDFLFILSVYVKVGVTPKYSNIIAQHKHFALSRSSI